LIVDLDSEASLDPGRVGAKAAWLAMARRAGLAVLPGFVIESAASVAHMTLGATALAARGSGGARLSITGEPVPFARELVDLGSALAPTLVARSSTVLEGSGEWSGAFTSYLDLAPADLPKAIAGVWSSAFTVSALERQEAAAVEPGSFPIAVLVQPALSPSAGGTARIDETGEVVVHGVEGSPAPLLQGWSGGHEARSRQGGWSGSDLIDLIGVDALDEIATQLRAASDLLGVDHCEWARDGSIWLLQLDVATPVIEPATGVGHDPLDHRLIRIAQLVVLAPGRLGEELILPWALGGGAIDGDPGLDEPPNIDLDLVTRLRDRLTAQVWGTDPKAALDEARQCITALRGPDPQAALDRLSSLSPPDSDDANLLLALVRAIRSEMVSRGAVRDVSAAWNLTMNDVVEIMEGVTRRPATRFGIGRWEPFLASVTLAWGEKQKGTPASPGVGAGLRCHIPHPGDMGTFSTRAVIDAPQPLPNLAPLLWDAAGLVTRAGSPAAHLFESARALGVPAVCGVDFDGKGEIVAIDGHNGVVATLALNGGDDG